MRGYIRRRYGSLSGCRDYLWHGLRTRLGAVDASREVRWESVERLVFACRGNICRSAYAEARARLLGLPAVSVGLDAATGSTADAVATAVAAQRGVDLTVHRSQRVEELGAHPGDLWLCMEPSHVAEVQERLGTPVELTLLGYWTAEGNPMIADPYGADPAYFNACFSRIDAAVDALAVELNRHNAARSAGD